MSTPLRELDAYLTTMDWGGGISTPILLFECPNPRCAREHSQGMPYSDAPAHRLPHPLGTGNQPDGSILLWQRTSGQTIDDITLSPSFVVQSCDGLHGFIRNGRWEPC